MYHWRCTFASQGPEDRPPLREEEVILGGADSPEGMLARVMRPVTTLRWISQPCMSEMSRGRVMLRAAFCALSFCVVARLRLRMRGAACPDLPETGHVTRVLHAGPPRCMDFTREV